MATKANDRTNRFFSLHGRKVMVLGRTFELPASRLARILIAAALIVGGCFSFLPILGIWMLPLGFMILSTDVAMVRRWRRRVEVRWNRWRRTRRAKSGGSIDVRTGKPVPKSAIEPVR